MSQLDSKALASAREVMALIKQEHIGGDVQLLAKIQNLFIEAMEYASPRGEPVSQPYKLPEDYMQGLKDGLEWAARLAEANNPSTGDWLYDDPLELAKAIRKGPDMPAEPVQGLTLREGLAAIRNSGIAIDASKIQAERDALNALDVPDGWVLVPIEPTPGMNKAGWAAMNEHDAIDPTYRAMLAAAPVPGKEG